MPRLAALHTALPPHRFTQGEIRRLVEKVHAGRPELHPYFRLFDRAGVETRHLSFPLGYYVEPRPFETRNADFVRKAVELGAAAARGALEKAGIRPERVDHVLVATTTGLATPSLEARLVEPLGLRRDVRRWPLVGLGCAGGAGALGRAAEIVGERREIALVLSVELSGQVFSHEARTPVDVLGAALFADGAAGAVVMGGEGLMRPASILLEKSADLMGWRYESDGMRLVLSEEIQPLLKSKLREAVDAALRGESPKFWALHAGGPRILEAYAEALGLGEAELAYSRRCLARIGNVSGASALFTLADLWPETRPGDRVFVAAPGPGFGVESVLIGC